MANRISLLVLYYLQSIKRLWSTGYPYRKRRKQQAKGIKLRKFTFTTTVLIEIVEVKPFLKNEPALINWLGYRGDTHFRTVMLKFENRLKISVSVLLIRSWVQDVQCSCSLLSYLKIFD
jgi:hypothetical protein